MPTPERAADRRAAHTFIKLALLQFLVTVALFGLVFYLAGEGRENLRESQLRGCARAKVDRSVNAQGWRTAEDARRASGTPNDLRAAARYDRIATSLERRAAIDCARAFPKS